MTSRQPPRIDPNLVTDRDVDRLPVGDFERQAAEIARLLATEKPAGTRQRPTTRWQDEVIAGEIPRGARVLDLGCGEGALLQRLMRERDVRGQGVEINAEAIFACVDRGVPVLQADLDEGLRRFPDGSFDVVVLEETLQTLSSPHDMLNEMLRVGRRGIVSFPNFAHWRVAVDLVARGRMPVTEWLPYAWYDSANIHPFTLRDLLDWAQSSGVRVVAGYALDEGQVRALKDEDNLHAEEVLVVVER
jgi:methionine biosynthesis protein MetW